MKVAISSKYIDEPFGGGNLFIKNLTTFLTNNGHTVTHSLKNKSIDIILIINPLLSSQTSAFSVFEAVYYKTFINKTTKLVHRVNECDERKNTKNVNSFLISINKYMDSTIYVSTWLKELFLNLGANRNNAEVILSGADESVFYSKSSQNTSSKVKLVTHHWSSHENKGYQQYKLIDELLDDKKWSEKFSFAFIGNINKNYNFKNIQTFPPLNELDLAKKLNTFDGYVTASINEPSGNHHIEAALSGLPILYIDSGGIPEYCDGYGLEFSKENFIEKLDEFLLNINSYKYKISSYPHNSSKMNNEYLTLFNKLLLRNDDNDFKNNKKKQLLLLFLIYRHKIQKFLKTILNNFQYHLGISK